MKATIVDGNLITLLVLILYGLLSFFLARLLVKVPRRWFVILCITYLAATHFMLIGSFDYARSLISKHIYINFGHAYLGFFILYLLLFLVALSTIIGSLIFRNRAKSPSEI